jgi:uncharacterized membrane protein HdeD (DUF308 family)
MVTQEENTWMPTVAGILDICAGISAVIGSMPIGFMALGFGGLALPIHSAEAAVSLGSFAFFFLALAALLIAAGVIAIVGGVHVLQRRSRLWSLAGAIAAVFSFFPLGIPAVILTVLAEKQLVDGAK